MECFSVAEWITAIAAAVTAYTVVVAWKQFKADHERSRREKSVELILEWSKSLNPKASSARKFAEVLNKEQTVSLFKQEEITIESKHKSLLEACLDVIEEKGSKIQLSRKQVSKVRWEIISYLNKLEAILSAWRHNVADRDIISEQFQYLIRPEDGHTLLEEFLRASKNSYPSIKEFAEHLNKQADQKNGKDKIA